MKPKKLTQFVDGRGGLLGERALERKPDVAIEARLAEPDAEEPLQIEHLSRSQENPGAALQRDAVGEVLARRVDGGLGRIAQPLGGNACIAEGVALLGQTPHGLALNLDVVGRLGLLLPKLRPEVFSHRDVLLSEPAEFLELRGVLGLEGTVLRRDCGETPVEFVPRLRELAQRLALGLQSGIGCFLLRLKLLVLLLHLLGGGLESSLQLLCVQREALAHGGDLPCLGLEIQIDGGRSGAAYDRR